MTESRSPFIHRPFSRQLPLLAMACILAFGLLIRLYDINRESFWADEGWTMILARGPTLPDIVQTMADDQHPPLYFALIHYWMAIFGNSEVITRLLSTFWSILGVALVYRLAADAFSPGAALAAALILALTDNDIMLAREARHYAQMAALAVGSSLFYLRYLRRPTRSSGIGWLLASVALLYTHYLGALLIGLQGVHALIFARPLRRLPDVLFRLAAIGVAWLPWALVFISQSSVRYTRPVIFQSTLPNTPETFAIVRGDLVGSHFGLTVGLMLLGLVYLTYSNGRARLKLRPMCPTALLGLWVAVPIVAIIALNTRFPILTTRNFLIVTPAIALLIGHGIMNLDLTARQFALAVLVVVGLFTVDAYHLKPPWRAVSQDILRYREGDEAILMDVWVDDFALRYHIGRDLNAAPETLPLVSLPEWRERYGQAFFANLLDYVRRRDSFWLAYWGQNQDGLLDFFVQHGFQRTATQVELHRDEEIFVYRYDRTAERTLARFGDLFALQRVSLSALKLRPGESLRVNLLWRALAAPGKDYSVSVFLLNPDGSLAAQHDGPPFDGRSPTSAWQPGDVRFDSHILTVPDAPGLYPLGIKVYWYAEPEPLSVAGASPPEYYTVGVIEVAQ